MPVVADVREVLALLAELAVAPDRGALAGLAERLDSGRLRVLVTGEAKRGKSTLVNALLGRPVLPAGVTPLTAVPITVREPEPGAPEDIEVAFADGRVLRQPLGALPDFGTERGNPGNCRQVSSITVAVTAPVLARGVEIVDTPGLGSVHAHNTAAAQRALPTLDAAIVVLAADPPVSAAERDLIGQVSGLSAAMFVVLNKADYLDETGLAEAAEFTTLVAGQAAGIPVVVYPLSARNALGQAGDPDFTAFRAVFETYLDDGRRDDLVTSVAGHAGRIARLMLDEAVLADHAARLPAATAEQRAGAFSAALAGSGQRRAEAEDRAGIRSRRLLAALNEAAETARAPLAAKLSAEMSELLSAGLAAAGPAEIERAGYRELTGVLTRWLDAWRGAQEDRLGAGLRELADQLADELVAELTAVRQAAAELLGCDLATPPPAPVLEPDLGFFYTLREPADQAELLAGAVRRHLPGELGRRLARRHLLGLIPELADRQLGRVRGDLQYRLAEATRRMVAGIRDGYEEQAGRLAMALEESRRIRSRADGAAAAELDLLAARQRTLRSLLARLGSPGSGPREPGEAGQGRGTRPPASR
jgi:GTP-binding protein EngB required for normal cell division